MKRILNYPGSKWRMADLIIQNMPDHKSYLEPFFGSGAVFFSKQKAVLETINDVDGRQQVIKIGRYYYVDDYNAETSLALSLNIQNVRWFDSSLQHHKKQMEVICLNYGGEVRDLLDELQSKLREEAE